MPLDADAQKVVELIVAANRPTYPSLTPGEAREVYLASRRVLQPELQSMAEIRDLSCPGPAGPIPLRLYRGAGAPQGRLQPCLVYYHGGGWVIGNIDSHEWVCRGLANRAQCAVISVDYRLAPEHKFPAAVDDCVAATSWIAENAASLGLDSSRIGVGGDSAGGNLAAVVALEARDRGAPKLCHQLLIYPATDMNATHASHKTHAEQLPLTRPTMLWFVEHYMRRPADKNDWRASPLKAPSFKGLPPAYVLTAGYDPLSDEGEEYAAKIKAAGVPTTVRRFDGQIHGFLNMGKIIAETHTAIDELGDALRQAFRVES